MVQNRNFGLAVVIGVLALAALAYAAYVVSKPTVVIAPVGPETGASASPSDGVFCTMDAKLCPDGSYVGRQGPNCEFSPCPGTPNPAPSPAPSPMPAPAPTSPY